MVSALDRKLLRDLWQVKTQALAISLVLASGVALLVMMLCLIDSIEETRSTYYDRYRFAHVFAHLKRAPNSLGDRIAELPGVSQVQRRIVVDVTLDIPNMSEPAVGRLISIPEKQTPGLNDVVLRKGRYIEPGRNGETLVSEPFAEAHKLGPGDKVTAVINGRKQRLTIVGIVLSPEFVYQIRPGDLLPDFKRFGVFWTAYTELAAAFNMQGAFNDVTLTLMPGASEPEVLQRLDRLIAPYGGLGAFGRENQVSHRFVSDQIRQLADRARVVPTIFLGVAAFLLNMVLARLIATQREQIAALKAFGYTNFQVGAHYLKMVLVLVAVGAALGICFGIWLGRNITVLYTQFYRFPSLLFAVNPAFVALGVLMSAGAAILGTLRSVRRAVLLPPAEALRPEPPATFRPALVERIGLQRLFSQTTRMILRQFERQPIKALLSTCALSLAVSIIVVGCFVKDALDYIMAYQFELSQRQDLSVSFVEPASPRAVNSIRHLPGVIHCEPFRSASVRLRHEQRTRLVAITGQAKDATLNRLLDENGQPVSLPEEGLLLSAKLGQLLDAEAGDVLTVEVLEGERPTFQVRVAGLVNDYMGTSAYMHLPALNRLLKEGSSVSGVYLTADAWQHAALYRTLKNTPRVAGVTIKNAAWQNFQDIVAQNLLIQRAFQIAFACIIAFGVVYNNARISLSERSRELATLRVIGFTRAEISAILLGEIGVLTLLAIPVGMAAGYGMAALTVLGLDTEMFRIPLVINNSTYGFAASVVVVATLFSALVVRRNLDHLDLVAVLKSKE
jgi:putative ABC transport system permease protein